MSDALATWVDGVEGNSVPADDRGLQYGDGVFETLLVRNGVPRFLAAHRDRLRRGLVELEIQFLASEELEADIGFLGQMVQNPAMGEALGKALGKRIGVQSLAGLDRSRPWGAVVETDGLRISPVAFVPVTDAAELLYFIRIADDAQIRFHNIFCVLIILSRFHQIDIKRSIK